MSSTPSDPGHSTPRIGPHDPPCFEVAGAQAAGPFLLVCDHAGRAIPRRLGSLGLSDVDLARHIAWDIGAAGAAVSLGRQLDSTVILQTYSRLVIDCNRWPRGADSIVGVSDGTPIPGNLDVAPGEARRRQSDIFDPYHRRIGQELDHRRRRGQPTLLISLHSFTPHFSGQDRPWHVGVLLGRDRRIGEPLLRALRDEPGLVVGENVPYALSDDFDYTVLVHGEQRGLPHVELELRQDLLADAAGQAHWSERLARLLRPIAAAHLA